MACQYFSSTHSATQKKTKTGSCRKIKYSVHTVYSKPEFHNLKEICKWFEKKVKFEHNRKYYKQIL